MIRAAGGPEENVAALNVGHHVAEALGFEADLELRHRDEIVATDVDGAQQCDVQVHGLFLTLLARQLRDAHVYRLRVSSPGISFSNLCAELPEVMVRVLVGRHAPFAIRQSARQRANRSTPFARSRSDSLQQQQELRPNRIERLGVRDQQLRSSWSALRERHHVDDEMFDWERLKGAVAVAGD